MTFKEYLDSRDETVYAFHKATRISWVTVMRLYKGGNVRKDIAKRIQRATKKKVTMEEMGYGEK